MIKKLITAAVLSTGIALPLSAATVSETFGFGDGVDTIADIEAQGDFFKSATAFNSFVAGAGVGEKGLHLAGKKGMGAKGGNGFGAVKGSRVAMGEALVLEFHSEVSLSTLVLKAKLDTDQMFALFVDGVAVSSANPATVSIPTGTTASVDFTGSSVSGTTFAFVGLSTGSSDNGLWLRSISVTGEQSSQIISSQAPGTFGATSPVPLPATAPLLAGALVVGAAALRRRRKS